MPDLMQMRWSVGESNGGLTAIWAELPPSGRMMIGVMESWTMADHVARVHNAGLDA
jgi:hypothetical protein